MCLIRIIAKYFFRRFELFSSYSAFKSVPHAEFKSASRGERVNATIRVVRMITINKFVVLRKNLIRCIVQRKKRKHTDWT